MPEARSWLTADVKSVRSLRTLSPLGVHSAGWMLWAQDHRHFWCQPFSGGKPDWSWRRNRSPLGAIVLLLSFSWAGGLLGSYTAFWWKEDCDGRAKNNLGGGKRQLGDGNCHHHCRWDFVFAFGTKSNERLPSLSMFSKMIRYKAKHFMRQHITAPRVRGYSYCSLVSKLEVMFNLVWSLGLIWTAVVFAPVFM